MTPTLYVQLGRTGDILSLLPLLWKDAQSGDRPKLMIAAEYAPLLEGVSYVEPVIFDGPHYDIGRAMAQARSHPGRVVCVQVNGPADQVLEHTYRPQGIVGAATTSFQKEAWRTAGRLAEWDNCYPLVFDQRDKAREAALIESCKLHKKKPLLLLSTKGNSSPFPYPELLTELIRLRFQSQFQILELPKAERMFDLLSLYQKAHCLVATDSAPLHLARAVPELPVIALVNDKPTLWNGSAWEPNWAWSCRYHDFPDRSMEMLNAIQTCRRISEGAIIRVWNQYDHTNQLEPLSRYQLPVYRGACGRDSASVLQDPKRVPYLRDCLRMALQRAKDGETVCITRPDTQVDAIGNLGCVGAPTFAYRINVRGEEKHFAPVVDLFAASKAWWKERLPEIPDLLLGSDHYWSQVLWAMFKRHGATDVTGVCWREGKA